MNCPFCPPKVNDNAILLENDLSLFIDLKQSILQGSGIIVPKAHRQSTFDLTTEEITSTFSLLTEVKTLLDTEYNPQGYNLGWNCGAVAGQTVFHAHLHVIPRYASEPYVGKGIRYWLKQESNRHNN
ncbi:HIT domain-containing protein [Candidatus Poribacteria bacterium]|nr:HIT domain-containing protein [Candidatus Poribacteria bacterium]